MNLKKNFILSFNLAIKNNATRMRRKATSRIHNYNLFSLKRLVSSRRLTNHATATKNASDSRPSDTHVIGIRGCLVFWR